MRDKAFVEGEQVVPSDDALRTYRHAFRAGTVGVVLAPDEETAPNQVRVEILDASAVAALDAHRPAKPARTLNWHQNWWTKATEPPTRLRRNSAQRAVAVPDLPTNPRR
jgi:hypothetical protein